MKGLKKVTAVMLLVTIMSLGGSPAWGGVVETPGNSRTESEESSTTDGTAESPGFYNMAIIFTTMLVM